MSLAELHILCTCAMTGIIWFVQLVQYPMLPHAGGPDAVAGHKEYTRRMGWVVIPFMFGELGGQIGWVLRSPSPAAWTGAGLLVLIWLSTFLIQVPDHHRLTQSYDARVHQRLVRGNWIRTLGWSLRAGLLLSV